MIDKKIEKFLDAFNATMSDAFDALLSDACDASLRIVAVTVPNQWVVFNIIRNAIHFQLVANYMVVVTFLP